jgi:hypothetical protein
MNAPEKQPNPYKAPNCDDAPVKFTNSLALSKKWLARCLVGLVATIVGFIGTMWYPRQWMFGNLLYRLPLVVLNLCMYAGPFVTVISGYWSFLHRVAHDE